MHGGKPLRLYANPVKISLYLLGSAAFVVAGLWLLRHPTANTSALTIAAAWVAIVFFGIGTAIFLLMFIRDVVLRRAILRIDEQGWTYRATLVLRKQTASWQDIEHIGIYRQWMGESRFRRRARYMYWLIAHGTDLQKVARVIRDPFSARLYPALRGSLIAVPLNMLFFRVSPQKLNRMLARIRTEVAFELRLYGVQVDDTIRDL
ncbi:MAG TPA: STM3941 family protein [Ktedonobacterales bacterium]|nr:STM3941 family protein [Ktedonobacterales bacterium]